MSNVRGLDQPPSRSGHAITDRLLRALGFARRRRAVAMAVVLIDEQGRPHYWEVRGHDKRRQDELLAAVTALYDRLVDEV